MRISTFQVLKLRYIRHSSWWKLTEVYISARSKTQYSCDYHQWSWPLKRGLNLSKPEIFVILFNFVFCFTA